MIYIGTDLVEKARIERLHGRYGERLAMRILDGNELSEYWSTSRKVDLLAKRFCAKEAISKVLGTGLSRGVRFQDIRIMHDGMGRPLVELKEAAASRASLLHIAEISISISDERHYCVAFAMGVPDIVLLQSGLAPS